MADFNECQLRDKMDEFDRDEGLKNLVKNCNEEMLTMERQNDKDWLRIKLDVKTHSIHASFCVRNEEELVEKLLHTTDADRSSLETNIKEVRGEFDKNLKKLENAYMKMERYLNKLGYSRLREQACVKNKAVAVALHAQDELKTKVEKGELDRADPAMVEANGAAKEAVDKHMASVYSAFHGPRHREKVRKRKLEEGQNQDSKRTGKDTSH